MGASGRELIVLADESEQRRRVPLSPTLICQLISRRGHFHCRWMSAQLEFPTLRDDNCHCSFIRLKVFPFYFNSLFFHSSGPTLLPWAACLELLVSQPPSPPICCPRLVHFSAPSRLWWWTSLIRACIHPHPGRSTDQSSLSRSRGCTIEHPRPVNGAPTLASAVNQVFISTYLQQCRLWRQDKIFLFFFSLQIVPVAIWDAAMLTRCN